MSKYYRGFWSFAPLPEMTTYVVEANNEDEAIEMLGTWAYAHQNCVDEPWDFGIEELDSIRFELAEKIVIYDVRYNEYSDDIWKVYENLADKQLVEEMIDDYYGDLIYHKDVVYDFQSHTPRMREHSEDCIKKISNIISTLEQIA